MPPSIYPIDTEFFLASFPRSGNTWIRFLIANVYNNIKKKFDEIDFFNIHEIIPEYGTEKKPFFGDLPHVLKTHKTYTPLFKNSILLLRAPCDTLYSYCDLLNKHRDLSISLKETVLHDEYGIKAIVDHTNSFVKNCENLLIMTYEKLHHDPGKEMRKICDFIEVNASDKIIENAVQKSSFQAMEAIEAKKGKKFGDSGFKHIRLGKIGEGKDALKKKSGLYRHIIRELKRSPLLYLLYS